jgi:ubiquinone/menaquinone biosynthesis C-methylase UbiE
MSVASHLHIRLDEYDSRIRTFIPGYDDMLDAASAALGVLDHLAPHLVDLGTGTGALASACLRVRPGARVTAIDADPEILELARQRLAGLATVTSFVTGRFDDLELPVCDAMVASLSLHHVRTADAKLTLYRRCRAALSDRGVLISADCCPATDSRVASLQHAVWRNHLRLSYTDAEAESFFAAWAEEDVYFPLDEELAMLRNAGFAGEVVWRAGPMAVILARAQSNVPQ